jgi:hypothetical protein
MAARTENAAPDAAATGFATADSRRAAASGGEVSTTHCTARAFAAAMALLALCFAASDARAQTRPEIPVSRAVAPPKIDGILDDEAWKGDPLSMDEWLSYNPLRGDRMSADLRTEVRIAYDDRNLYFAFHCFDKEPDKIRTTISRRDNAFNDDWIAVSLDSANTGQTAYHLFVNPSGIQMDALNTSASGEQFDADFVWYSAAKVTADGYVVEIQLPLQTLRFGSGADVRMGVLFFRKISRLGLSYSWPSLPPGQWVFERHARLRFDRLTQPRLVEALPSVTYGINQARAARDRWDAADGRADVGMSGKFGLTSNVTLDGTINPDFSQVESDAFQVEVNQRFPIFFSEKRPFFMEGMGLFNIAGTGGDSNMRTAVHTRRIVNPFWGSKLTGTAGRTTFGVLNAADESPDPIAASGGSGDAGLDRDKYYTIARATYALRRADYVGAIATDTEHAGRHNRVAGADLSLKFTPPQQFSATILASDTAAASAGTQGLAAQVMYGYETRRFNIVNQFEHFDRGFQMDTAFLNRVGFTTGWSFGEVNFYPADSSGAWLQRVHPFYFFKGGHDDIQNGSERMLSTGVRFHFTRQGYLEASRSNGHEPWIGRRFDVGRDIHLNGNVQLLRWLELTGSVTRGPAIFYDPIDPFQGRLHEYTFGLTLQPDPHFSQKVDVDLVRFTRDATGARVFDVNIVNSKTTYQFSKHFLVRLLEQFDSSANQLLTDLLGSYEFVPGTVFHAGYGSLYERPRALSAGIVNPLGTEYLLVNRGLFFKASYLHRF